MSFSLLFWGRVLYVEIYKPSKHDPVKLVSKEQYRRISDPEERED